MNNKNETRKDRSGKRDESSGKVMSEMVKQTHFCADKGGVDIAQIM